MKSIKETEKLIERSYLNKLDAPPDTEMDERILGDAVTKMGEVRRAESVSAGANIWRIIMKNRMIKLTATAVLAIAIIVGIVETGKPLDGASAVYAAAMDSIREAGTFSCIEMFEVTYEKDGKRGKYLMKQKEMFKEPDLERHEELTSPWPKYIGEITITDYGARRELRLRPAEKTALLYDLSADYTVDNQTGELKLTELDTRLRDKLLQWSAGAVEDHGKVELDEQSVLLLQSHRGNRITTLWIDPETNYPVQIEHKWTDENRSPVMYTSIQIDTGLDDDLFSLEPPDGYTVKVGNPGWSEDQQKRLAKIMHLGKCCLVYANQHNDMFPEEPADLVTAKIISSKALGRVRSAPDDPDGPPLIQYRRPDRNVADWSTEAVLYEVYDEWPDTGAAVCFLDGHSEIIQDRNRYEQLIE
jgi:hypothetical protein